MDDSGAEDLFPKRVGERLVEARRERDVDLSDIATRTRIPQRHLEAIEEGRFDDLPAPTYAIGFAKSYARVLGIDEVAIARDLRAELDAHGGRAPAADFFEPADPARVPPRWLVWTTLAIILAFGIGYLLLRPTASDELGGRTPSEVAAGIGDAPAPGQALPARRTAQAPPPAPTGDVVLTASGPVWLRVTDASGTRLLEKEMARGERFQVPADAREPRILTSRANNIQVTVGGRPVAPLGPPETRISDVAISAAALARRSTAAPPPSSPPSS